MRRLLVLLLIALPLSAADLPAYLAQKDDSYAWKVATELQAPGCTITVIDLTSQTWQGIVWEHWMEVFVPAQIKHPDDSLLMVDGGSNRKDPPKAVSKDWLFLATLAVQSGSVMAIVSQVPNEPLFEGKKEDGLIAYTFQKYLDTKDESWPCLLPMVKSAMRAMDTVQAFVKEKGGKVPERFVVTGASKRGWTTWLTGAADTRVEAIAPMVIDSLNMGPQMQLQVRTFGGFSEQIHDYVDLDLPKKFTTPEGQRLVEMVDPYSYRERLKMPKLIVLGTNDRYWPVDAVKLYYPGLVGEKYIHYVPNAGHGLGGGAVEAIAAFYQTVLLGEQRPRFSWKTEQKDGESVLTITAEDKPTQVALWTAASPTRDFRDQKWTSAPLAASDAGWVAHLKLPVGACSAYFAELTYQSTLGLTYTLSTNVEVLEAAPVLPPAAQDPGK